MPLEDLDAIVERLASEPSAQQLLLSLNEEAAVLLGCFVYIGALRGLEEVSEILARAESIDREKLNTFLQERTDNMIGQVLTKVASLRATGS